MKTVRTTNCVGNCGEFYMAGEEVVTPRLFGFEPLFKVHNLVSVHSKNAKLFQMSNVTVILHLVCLVRSRRLVEAIRRD